MNCPNCGEEMSGDERFCRKCGTRLNDVKETIVIPNKDYDSSSSNNPNSYDNMECCGCCALIVIIIFILYIVGIL